MKNKDLESSEEIEEIKIREEKDLFTELANKLNKDQSKVLEELALIIKGKLGE